MESEGVYEEIDARLVVRSEVDCQGFAASRALHGHFPRVKLNIKFLCFVDDRVAKVFIGVGGLEADAGGDLRGDVPHVCLQFEIGDLTGSDLPADSDGQAENRQSEENFGFSAQDDSLQPGLNVFYSEWTIRGGIGSFLVANWIA
jgi:hypothetical protein